MSTVRGLTLVFLPAVHRNSDWVEKGVPEMFIHNCDFKKVIDMTIDRQKALRSKDIQTPVNIILDYDSKLKNGNMIEEFWQRELKLTTNKRHYEALGVIFHTNGEEIHKVVEPEPALKFNKMVTDN